MTKRRPNLRRRREKTPPLNRSLISKPDSKSKTKTSNDLSSPPCKKNKKGTKEATIDAQKTPIINHPTDKTTSISISQTSTDNENSKLKSVIQPMIIDGHLFFNSKTDKEKYLAQQEKKNAVSTIQPNKNSKSSTSKTKYQIDHPLNLSTVSAITQASSSSEDLETSVHIIDKRAVRDLDLPKLPRDQVSGQYLFNFDKQLFDSCKLVARLYKKNQRSHNPKEIFECKAPQTYVNKLNEIPEEKYCLAGQLLTLSQVSVSETADNFLKLLCVSFSVQSSLIVEPEKWSIDKISERIQRIEVERLSDITFKPILIICEDKKIKNKLNILMGLKNSWYRIQVVDSMFKVDKIMPQIVREYFFGVEYKLFM